MDSELKIVLASSSPRRKKLLEELFEVFTIAQPSSDEDSVEPDPRVRVFENSRKKTESVVDRYPDSIIIGADTVVYLDGIFLGKPIDEKEAIEMLELLSGKTHSVYTGVYLINTSTVERVSGVEETTVRFRVLDEKEILAYVSTGRPLDKAGSYGIQEDAGGFVEDIQGSWSNVVGLPLELLEELLSELNS